MKDQEFLLNDRLAHFTQHLRRATTTASGAGLSDVDKGIQAAHDLDQALLSSRLSDEDVQRAAAIYACPPLVGLTSPSPKSHAHAAHDLYLRTLLTNRDLPDPLWHTLVSRDPPTAHRILDPVADLMTTTASLTSALHTYTIQPPYSSSLPPPPLSVPMTPLHLPRLATARLLLLHTPQLTFSLFVSKHLPALLSADPSHVELALCTLLVPDAPNDRVLAVVDVLVQTPSTWVCEVNEHVCLAAAAQDARVRAVYAGGLRRAIQDEEQVSEQTREEAMRRLARLDMEWSVCI